MTQSESADVSTPKNIYLKACNNSIIMEFAYIGLCYTGLAVYLHF